MMERVVVVHAAIQALAAVGRDVELELVTRAAVGIRAPRVLAAGRIFSPPRRRLLRDHTRRAIQEVAQLLERDRRWALRPQCLALVEHTRERALVEAVGRRGPRELEDLAAPARLLDRGRCLDHPQEPEGASDRLAVPAHPA